MTLFPDSVIEAAPADANPILRVSTKYMETFVPVQPVSSGTELHTFANRAGVLDIYSVGTDGQVNRLRRGQDAAAPYESTPLGVYAQQLFAFTSATGDADRPAIFGLDGRGGLTLSTHQPSGSYLQRPCHPASATEAIDRFLGVRGVTGRIYVNVILRDGRLATNYYDPLKQTWGGGGWAPVLGPNGKEARVESIAMAANDPLQSALFAIGKNGEVLFGEDSFRTTRLRSLGKRATHLAVVTDAESLLCVFAAEQGTGRLWLKRQRKHSTQGIQFDDWVEVDPGQMGQLGELRANLRVDNLVEVFAYDASGALCYTRQTATASRGKPAIWLPLFPLAARPAGLVFTTGRNANGYSEAYAVTPESDVYRFWQSPRSEQWFSEQLEVPARAQTLASMPTHAAELTIVDDEGLPLGGADVTVNTSFLTTIWVDGRAYRCSMLDPVRLKASPSGKLVVHQRASSLAAATLLVSTPRTPAGSPIVVEPNGQLLEKLAALDTQQVLDAKDAQGRPLLPLNLKHRSEVGESLTQITRQAMNIAQAEGPGAAVRYEFTSLRRPGLQTRLNLSSLGETAWQIDFSAGYPRYRDMTAADAQAYRVEALAAPGEIFGVDWGSVWNAIKDGVAWVVNGISKIVVTIVDGVARILFEIAGKVFEAVLEAVQQAFDFVEGVWNWLKVTFERLYEWLAYLFNFEDFARTATGVKHTMSVTFDVADYAVQVVRAQVENGFDVLKGNLSKVVDELVAQLHEEGEPSIGGSFRQNPPTDGQVYAGDHNIFLNAFSENQGAIRSVGGGAGALAVTPALEDKLGELIERLTRLADNFEFGDGKAAFDEALGYFDSVGSQPNRAVELILSGLVRALQGVALYALDFAKGVVLTLIDLIAEVLRLLRDALFEAWEIPVVSQLYKLFTGKSLAITPVDVVAWCAAIPATIFSKLVLGRSPFPDDAALEQFRKTFTVDMIKARMGGQPAAEVAEWDPRWREIFLCGYAAVMLVRPLLDAGLAVGTALGKGEDPRAEKAEIVAIAMEAMTLGFTAPWALSGEAGAPSCAAGEVGFEVTMWICHVALGPLRAAAIHKAPPGKVRTYTAEITLSLWGVAGLIMAIWNFVAGPQHTADKLAFSRELTANIPGQALHFLCLPDINKETYYIPVGILAALILLGYWGSFGVAIAELKTAPLLAPPSTAQAA